MILIYHTVQCIFQIEVRFRIERFGTFKLSFAKRAFSCNGFFEEKKPLKINAVRAIKELRIKGRHF